MYLTRENKLHYIEHLTTYAFVPLIPNDAVSRKRFERKGEESESNIATYKTQNDIS